jgi:hypothetical protein
MQCHNKNAVSCSYCYRKFVCFSINRQTVYRCALWKCRAGLVMDLVLAEIRRDSLKKYGSTVAYSKKF